MKRWRAAQTSVLRVATLLSLVLSAVSILALSSARAQNNQPAGRLLFVRDGAAWVWENGSANQLFGDGTISDARWSPDGREILFVTSQSEYSDLAVWDSQTETITQLTDNAPASDYEPGSLDYANWSSWARDPSWSASGRIGFIADYDVSGRLSLYLMESPEASVTAALEYDPSSRDIEGVSLSTTGELAAYTERTFDGAAYSTTVVLRDLSDGVVYPLFDDDTAAFDPAISPDEQWIATTIRSTSGVSDIWIVARSGLSSSHITLGAQANAPTWSPAGDWVAYLRPSGDGFELLATPVGAGVPTGEAVSLGSWDGIDATSGLSWTTGG